MFEPRGGGSAAPLNKEAMVKGLWAQAILRSAYGLLP